MRICGKATLCGLLWGGLYGLRQRNEEMQKNRRKIRNKEEKEMREIGIVKWFSAEKGFGFIERSNGSDIFVHFQDIQMDGYRTLVEGEKVSFEVEDTAKGTCARKVRRGV